MEMYLINFANSAFKPRQELAVQLATNYGVQHVFAYTEEELKSRFANFYQKHIGILSLPRGCGYWLWKPFLIIETMKLIPRDSILMYCDSGALLVNSPLPLFELALLHNQIFFNMPKHLNRIWVKRDIFVTLGCDEAKYWDAAQVKAQCCLWKNCPDSLSKLEEWFNFCQNPQLITDVPSIAQNFPEFIENRHDQSILSVLVTKWGNQIFRDPSQEGMQYTNQFPNSTYGMILSALGKP